MVRVPQTSGPEAAMRALWRDLPGNFTTGCSHALASAPILYIITATGYIYR
jgi:hypothetical protein